MICTGGVYGDGPRNVILLQTVLVKWNKDSGSVPRSWSGGNDEEKKSLAEFIRLHRPPFIFRAGLCMKPRWRVVVRAFDFAPPPPTLSPARCVRGSQARRRTGCSPFWRSSASELARTRRWCRCVLYIPTAGRLGALLGRLCYALVCLRCLRCSALLACPGFRCLLALAALS